MFPGTAGDVHYYIGAGPGDIRDISDNVFNKYIKLTRGVEKEKPDNIKIAGAPAQVINIRTFYQELLHFFRRAYFHLDAHDAHKI